jgi:hypothetical protein
MNPSARLPSSAALLATAALLVLACGTPASSASQTPSPTAAPSSSQDVQAVYASINAQVQVIRGLEERKPVVPKIVSSDELATVLRASLDKDYPPAKIALDEKLYKGLGLLPADADLKAVILDLLTSQVAGTYDPTTKDLYVLSKQGGVGPAQQFYYSHEYDHALQDQHFDLEAFQKGFEDDSDQLLARQSLVEGDAYTAMTYWMQQNLDAAEIGEVMALANDPATIAALQRIPPIIQTQLMFSALQGTLFIAAQQREGGWTAIDAMFAAPPQSTEQILHPDKWASREAPKKVELPADLAKRMGSGWSVAMQDTLGEEQLQVWLGGQVKADAAAGWGGDRIALLEGPKEQWAIAWHTVWDSDADAAEFEADALDAVAKAGGKGSVLPGEGGTTRWVVIGSDDAVLTKIAGVLGLAG